MLDKIFEMTHIAKLRCRERERERMNKKIDKPKKRREKNVCTQTLSVCVSVYLLFSLSRIHFTRAILFVTTNKVNKRNQSITITEKNDDDDRKQKV